MLKIILLIGPETPMDLLLLTHFLNDLPECELKVGVQKRGKFTLKRIIRLLKVLKSSGISFFLMNVILNLRNTSWLIFDKDSMPDDIADLRKEKKFSLFSFDKVNSEDTLSVLKEFNPDVIFNHMPQRIKYPLIKTFPDRIINIHPGLLPEFQGMGSCVWPLINRAKYSGTSLHFIDTEEFDVGPIVITGRFIPHQGASSLSMQVRARVIAAKLAVHVVERLKGGSALESRVQKSGVYRKLPVRKDFRSLKRNGYTFFSWGDRALISNGTAFDFEYSDETTSWAWETWKPEQ